MKEQTTPGDGQHPVALYRYQVVSMVLCREQTGESRPLAIKTVAEVSHPTPTGDSMSPSERSVYRWLAEYEEKGFDGLLPKPRKKIEVSLVLDPALLDFCKEQKANDPNASIPELIDRARLKGVISPVQSVNRTTLWRALRRMGLDTTRRKQAAKDDKRRFSFPHRLEMVLCDGKHFRAGAGRLKRVALFFIDDATRLILGVVVGTSESAELFLRGLHKVIGRYGLMTRLFVDNGSGFKAGDATAVLANLGVAFIHGTVGYPQGRGKIERFNRTIRDRLLRHLQTPEVDPDPAALELRLEQYTDNLYSQSIHASLDGKTPRECFQADERPLRFPENREALGEKFVLHNTRRVSADNIVKLNGEQYELMRGYAGAHVRLRRNLLDGSVSMIHDGRLVRLAPVDQHANARRPPVAGQKNNEETAGEPECAANLAHQRNYKPIVDENGDFPKVAKNNKTE